MKRTALSTVRPRSGSRPARGAWIETEFPLLVFKPVKSRPARGAWIETWDQIAKIYGEVVAPRAGRVD